MSEYSFHGQRQGEKVMEVVKNHPFVFYLPGIKIMFLLLAAIAAMLFLPVQIAGVILVLMVLISISIFVKVFYNYSQSVFIITTQRVINVDQDGFWKRRITETEINKIQDVSSKTTGMYGVMLKFGNLMIRTAGASEENAMVVKCIPDPYDVQQKIAGLIK